MNLHSRLENEIMDWLFDSRMVRSFLAPTIYLAKKNKKKIFLIWLRCLIVPLDCTNESKMNFC